MPAASAEPRARHRVGAPEIWTIGTSVITGSGPSVKALSLHADSGCAAYSNPRMLPLPPLIPPPEPKSGCTLPSPMAPMNRFTFNFPIKFAGTYQRPLFHFLMVYAVEL